MDDDFVVQSEENYNFFYLMEPAPEKWYVYGNERCGYTICKTRLAGIVFTGTKEECERWIEEQSKPKYRPFKNCDELITTYLNNSRSNEAECLLDNSLPVIWVKKKNGSAISMITNYNISGSECIKDTVDFSYGLSTDLEYLFDNFTFLDESPCGVEIKE